MSSSLMLMWHPLKMFFSIEVGLWIMFRSVSHLFKGNSLGSFSFYEINFFMPNSFSFSLEILDYRSFFRSV